MEIERRKERKQEKKGILASTNRFVHWMWRQESMTTVLKDDGQKIVIYGISRVLKYVQIVASYLPGFP